MTKVLKAPEALPIHRANNVVPKSVFLAGSINDGAAEDWQEKVTNILMQEKNIDYIFNPRRDFWNTQIEPVKSNAHFYEQVSWEMTALDISEVILINLCGEGISPITLLELGLYARSKKVVVSCHPKFFRQGNVEVVCERFGIPFYSDIESAISNEKFDFCK